MQDILKREDILLGLASESLEDVIHRAGALLVRSGYVSEDYPASMLERERDFSTCMGLGIAMPHGMSEAKDSIKKCGIAVLQYPDGVVFGGEKVYLVIAVAGVACEHIEILAQLSQVLEDEAIRTRLYYTSSVDFVYNSLKFRNSDSTG